jgi:hypothetical protein
MPWCCSAAPAQTSKCAIASTGSQTGLQDPRRIAKTKKRLNENEQRLAGFGDLTDGTLYESIEKLY